MCPAFKEVSGIVQMERAAVDKDLRHRWCWKYLLQHQVWEMGLL